MSDPFRRYIDRILSHEGGYTDHERDKGNWTGGIVGVGLLKGTKYGIAANTYPDLDIRNLTRDQAIAIYERDFWQACHCHALPASFTFQLLDAAVNHGIRNAKRMLQRAARVVDDGRVGPVTLAALQAMPAADLLLRFTAERIMFYTRLNDFDEFGRGWMRRMAGNLLHAAEDN